jgi:hypothetical protein
MRVGIKNMWGSPVLTPLHITAERENINCTELMEYEWSSYSSKKIFEALVKSIYSEQEKKSFVENYAKLD